MRLLLVISVFTAVEASDFDYYDYVAFEKELAFSCNSQKDGIYSAGLCKNHYYICDHERRITVNCPLGLIYNGKHCHYKEETPECPAYKTDWDILKSIHKSSRDTICERKVDGQCHFACENEYYSCKNGTVTWHKCPIGLVRRGDKCVEREGNHGCLWMQAIEKISFCAPVAKMMKKDFPCFEKESGYYSAGPCLNHFNICLNKKQIPTQCPIGMVFWKGRCHFKRDVEECPGYKTGMNFNHSNRLSKLLKD